MRANWLKNKDKLATQVGTQRHEIKNFNRVREMIRDGAIGELEEACAWGNRQLRQATDICPPRAIRPATSITIYGSALRRFIPTIPITFSGDACVWNMFWDFGSGQVGDMGSHTMDLAWNAIDAGLPPPAEGKGDQFNPDVTPVNLGTLFRYSPPTTGDRRFKVSWYQGGAIAGFPCTHHRPEEDRSRRDVQGSKGTLSPVSIPRDPRPANLEQKRGGRPDLLQATSQESS